MNAQEIERHWRLFHTVIPASTADANRRRTPYFFKREAIAWVRNASRSWYPLSPEKCTGLAKEYLRRYREEKAARKGGAK